MLVIIDPSTRHPEAEVCAQIIREYRGIARVVRPALSPDSRVDTRPEAPSSESWAIASLEDLPLEDIRGVMILGGGASPTEELAWQTELTQWLKQPLGPISRRSPILGICYGHQLLGSIFGGAIELLWEGVCAKGLRAVSLSESSLGLEARQSYPLVISHREGLRDPPKDWRALCATTHITGLDDTPPARAVEAMRHAEAPWWGFQAHIDATPAFMTNNHIGHALPEPYAGLRVIRSFLQLL